MAGKIGQGDVFVDHFKKNIQHMVDSEIAVRHSQRQATTEDLRKGMIHYRALFDELIEGVPVRMRAPPARVSPVIKRAHR